MEEVVVWRRWVVCRWQCGGGGSFVRETSVHTHMCTHMHTHTLTITRQRRNQRREKATDLSKVTFMIPQCVRVM